MLENPLGFAVGCCCLGGFDTSRSVALGSVPPSFAALAFGFCCFGAAMDVAGLLGSVRPVSSHFPWKSRMMLPWIHLRLGFHGFLWNNSQMVLWPQRRLGFCGSVWLVAHYLLWKNPKLLPWPQLRREMKRSSVEARSPPPFAAEKRRIPPAWVAVLQRRWVRVIVLQW